VLTAEDILVEHSSKATGADCLRLQGRHCLFRCGAETAACSTARVPE
jgi:hypothetical protein